MLIHPTLGPRGPKVRVQTWGIQEWPLARLASMCFNKKWEVVSHSHHFVSSWATSDKTNKMIVSPAKTLISLGIHPVWSESSLSALKIAKDPSFLHADSRESDQIGQMPRLIWVFAGRTCHFVGFVMRRLILFVFICFSTTTVRYTFLKACGQINLIY